MGDLLPILWRQAGGVCGYPVSRLDFAEREIHADGFLVARVIHAMTKGAARRGIVGRRDVAFEENFFALHLGIGDGDGGEECLGVGVFGTPVDRFRIGELDDFTEIHDGDAVADVLHHGEVVGDEEVGEAEVFLEIDEKVEDLGLDGDIESGRASCRERV